MPEGHPAPDLWPPLAARGKSAGIRPALHPGWLRCSSLKYSRYSRSSRLAIRAHHRPRCSPDFHHGLLAHLTWVRPAAHSAETSCALAIRGPRRGHWRLRSRSRPAARVDWDRLNRFRWTGKGIIRPPTMVAAMGATAAYAYGAESCGCGRLPARHRVGTSRHRVWRRNVPPARAPTGMAVAGTELKPRSARQFGLDVRATPGGSCRDRSH